MGGREGGRARARARARRRPVRERVDPPSAFFSFFVLSPLSPSLSLNILQLVVSPRVQHASILAPARANTHIYGRQPDPRYFRASVKKKNCIRNPIFSAKSEKGVYSGTAALGNKVSAESRAVAATIKRPS